MSRHNDAEPGNSGGDNGKSRGKPQDSEPIIAVENLSAGYDRKVIFENINFKIFKSEKFLILGESGCGKSTLLRHLLGLQSPISGRIWIKEMEVTCAETEEMTRIRNRIGVLFQQGALMGSLTLLENISLPVLRFRNLSEEAVTLLVREKLAMVELTGYENHMPSELSGGMRTRAALARALALDPEIIFLDEPTSGLDPVTGADIDDLIKKFNDAMGTTFVIITQDLGSMFNICDRAIMIDKDGKGIIAEGVPMQLKKNSNNNKVKRFFNRTPAIKSVES